jgi:hypothetical protein
MRKSAETSETADQSLKITQTIHKPFWIGLSWFVQGILTN